jgi:hypothetical protein
LENSVPISSPLTLASDVVKDQKEHQLQDHWRRNLGVAVGSVQMVYLVVDEVGINGLGDLAKGMVGPNTLIEVKPSVEDLWLRSGLSTHHGSCLLVVKAIMV